MIARPFNPGRHALAALLALLLATGACLGVEPTPPPPQSPTPIVPIPAKGALIHSESGVRTFVRFEFPTAPSPALDPTTADWTLNLYDTPDLTTTPPTAPTRSSVSKTFTLAHDKWTSPQAGKFVYSGDVTAKVDQRTFILEATVDQAFVNSSLPAKSPSPNANAISAVLNVGGKTYYTLFDGKVWANTSTSFKAHDSLIPALWKTFSTTNSITDLTTGQQVNDASLLSNLQSAFVFPDGATGHQTSIDIALPDGCYSVEFLFSEIDPAVDATHPRQFLVSAPELGLANAAVNLLDQLSVQNVYYPGAYVASGPVRDGFLSITFTKVSGAPILSGLVITALKGCYQIPDSTLQSPLVIDFGADTLPAGVYIYEAPTDASGG